MHPFAQHEAFFPHLGERDGFVGNRRRISAIAIKAPVRKQIANKQMALKFSINGSNFFFKIGIISEKQCEKQVILKEKR